MLPVKHDEILLSDERRIGALVKALGLADLKPKRPKPRPGSVSMKAKPRRAADRDPLTPEELARFEAFNEMVRRKEAPTEPPCWLNEPPPYWRGYFYHGLVRWARHRRTKALVCLCADEDTGLLHRWVISGLTSDKEANRMRREFERRDADTDEIEQLVSEIIASRLTSQRAKGRSRTSHFDKLKASRKKYEELREAIRDEGFDAWVRMYLVAATRPSEWTQARELYENYLKRAAKHGRNMGDKVLSKLEL